MGKRTYLVDGNYYLIDDETMAVKKVVVQDDAKIPPEVFKELLMAVLADTKPFTPKMGVSG